MTIRNEFSCQCGASFKTFEELMLHEHAAITEVKTGIEQHWEALEREARALTCRCGICGVGFDTLDEAVRCCEIDSEFLKAMRIKVEAIV